MEVRSVGKVAPADPGVCTVEKPLEKCLGWHFGAISRTKTGGSELPMQLHDKKESSGKVPPPQQKTSNHRELPHFNLDEVCAVDIHVNILWKRYACPVSRV